MQVPDSRQDFVLVGARFPRDLYEQLYTQAQVNMRSVGKECVFLCKLALRERQQGIQQEQQKEQAINCAVEEILQRMPTVTGAFRSGAEKAQRLSLQATREQLTKLLEECFKDLL